MYHLRGRVRYSEVDENRRLTLSGLINYLQDCCSFHSEDLGIGLDFLQGHHNAWVITGWEIEIARLPVYPEEIDVQTWPYSFAGFTGNRNFQILDKSGACIVRADSRWVFVDTQSGHPQRIPKQLGAMYTQHPALQMDKPPRKLAVDENAVAREPFVVQQKHLDTNHHVNNGQYAVMALEYLPQGHEITGISIEYKTPAVLGDRICPFVTEREQRVQVALCNEKKEPYAVVVLKSTKDPLGAGMGIKHD